MGSAVSTDEASHTVGLASDTITSYPSRIVCLTEIACTLGMEVEPSLAPAEALDRDAQAHAGSLMYDQPKSRMR